MNQTASPVLVTGGAGFIGSHLSDALLAAGHRVVVFDDLSTGKRERVPSGARFVEGDLRRLRPRALLREERIAAVFHHAAQIDVRKSVEDPVFDAEVNVLGTIRLAKACVAAGVSQILFASSGGAIYGDPEGFAADEDHPTNPVSPYGDGEARGREVPPVPRHGDAARRDRSSATRTSTARGRTARERPASSGSG